MSTRKTKINRNVVDTQLITGFGKHQADLPPSIVLSGQARTQAECITLLQGRIDIENKVSSEQAALQKAHQQQRAERAATDPFVHDLREWLLITYRNSPETLTDFGIALPKKSGPKTTATKVVAAAKGKATREARHTASKKEKAKIHGTLTGPVVVADGGAPVAPPVAPPTAGPADAPAPAAAAPATTAGNGGSPQGPANGSHA